MPALRMGVLAAFGRVACCMFASCAKSMSLYDGSCFRATHPLAAWVRALRPRARGSKYAGPGVPGLALQFGENLLKIMKNNKNTNFLCVFYMNLKFHKTTKKYENKNLYLAFF